MSYSEFEFRQLDQAFERVENLRAARMQARAGNPSNEHRTLTEALAFHGYTHARVDPEGQYRHRIVRNGRVVREASAYDSWNWLERLERKLSALRGAQ